MTRVVAAQGLVEPAQGSRRWGRYVVYGEIASGGMATIEYGRLLGPRGFARPVAIKRLHPQFAKDPDFVTMFADEARMSARVHHANVIPSLDVVEGGGELALVMEYVHGESLATLLELARARGELVPVPVAVTLLCGVLHGLHAAHEATGEGGEPMQIVHRDVSPQNVLIGADGVPRVLDFGVAKAKGRLRTTPSGEIKGKLAYIAPEQLGGASLDRRADVYGASAVLWEALAGRPLFDGPNESAIVHAVLNQGVEPPSRENGQVTEALDRIVLRGLSRTPSERFASAREMALALEHEVGTATQSELGAWLQNLAGARLQARARTLQQMEQAVEQALGAADFEPSAQNATRKLALEPGGEASRGTPRALAGPQPERRQAPGARHALWAAFGAAVIALAGFGLMRGQAAPSPAATPAPEAAAEAAARGSSDAPPRTRFAPPALAAPPEAPVADARDAASERAAQGTEVHAATAQPDRRPASPRRGQAGRRPRAIERARPRECNPPYVIDRDGVRHLKPECL